MAGLNKVCLIGHLGADPESRTFSNGNKVVNLRLATSESWKDRDGNRQERTEWHTVAIFNEGLAGIAENYLRKGSKVYIEGQLQTRKWQDQQGADRYSTEVVLQKFRGEIVLLDSRESGGQSGGGSSSGGGNGGGGYSDRGTDDRARSNHGFGGGREDSRGNTGQRTPQQSSFDNDLDDDVPF